MALHPHRAAPSRAAARNETREKLEVRTRATAQRSSAPTWVQGLERRSLTRAKAISLSRGSFPAVALEGAALRRLSSPTGSAASRGGAARRPWLESSTRRDYRRKRAPGEAGRAKHPSSRDPRRAHALEKSYRLEAPPARGSSYRPCGRRCRQTDGRTRTVPAPSARARADPSLESPGARVPGRRPPRRRSG